MNNQPLVTIGIPTYNRPEYLKIALDSVINQTYKNLEIIVSDNCSENPEVEKLCREYAQKDSRIKYFRQAKNIGIGANGQFLINKSKGELFYSLCDDDWLSSNFIEECVNIFYNNLNASVVYGRTITYDANYKILQDNCYRSIIDECYIQRSIDYVKNAVKYRLATGMVKTENIKQIRDYNKNRFCEDQIYMLKMVLPGQFFILPNICYHKLDNGSTKDLDTLKKSFNLPYLTQDNFWKTLSAVITEAVLFDDFFVERLEQSKRVELALEVHSALMSNKQNEQKPPKILIKDLLKYMYRKPLFLFRKDFYKKLKELLAR